MTNLAGRSILVTGASAGIGRAAARLFAQSGAFVILSARREAEGRAAAAEAGGDARFIACDFADPVSIDALFARIERDHGAIDGAFNNAAMTHDAIPLDLLPGDAFDPLFALNVRGVWACMRHELRIMRANGGGAIVNTASIAGLRGIEGLSLYCASKHAVIGLTKSAALDAAAYGVRVNCICPGATRTEMMDLQMRTRAGGEEATLSTIPLGRMAASSEQAEAAAWLLSDQASYITGETLAVDGGRTVR